MALPRVLLYLRGVQTALAVLALALLSYAVHTNVYWSNLGSRAAIGIIASILTLLACAVFMFLHLNGNYPAKPLWPVLVDSVLFAVWLGATIQILRSNTYMQELELDWGKAKDGEFVVRGPPKGAWYTAGAVGCVQMLGHAVAGFVGWWKTRQNM